MDQLGSFAVMNRTALLAERQRIAPLAHTRRSWLNHNCRSRILERKLQPLYNRHHNVRQRC